LRGLQTWPAPGEWLWASMVGVVVLALMGGAGLAGGLLRLSQARFAGWPWEPMSLLVAPALGEEVAFRGLWVPDRTETMRPARAIALVTVIFTLWHVVEAMTFLPRAGAVFLRLDFLACAAILGLGCGLMRWRTASIWPAVALHWIAVVGWLTWLGGPRLADLM